MGAADLANIFSGENASQLGIAQLINSLAPIFLGSGKTTENTTGASTGATTGTTAGTQTGTQTSSSTSGAAPDVITSLLQQLALAQSQSTDPTLIQPLIDNIIHQNLLAFGPTIAEGNTSGIYNSSTIGLLAGEAASRSAAQTAATALNFRTSEQQIAANLGATLAQTTATKDTTAQTAQQTQQQTAQQTAQNTQQTGTKQTSPILGNSALPLLGALGLTFAGDKLGVTGKDGIVSNLLDKLFGGSNTANPEALGAIAAGNADIGTATSGGVFSDLAAGNPNLTGSPSLFDVGGAVGGGKLPFSSVAENTAKSLVGPSGAELGAGNTTTLATPGDNPLLGPLAPGVNGNAPLAFNFTTSEPIAGLADATGLGAGLQTPSDAEALLGLGSDTAGAAATAGTSDFFGDAVSGVSDFIKTGLANQPGSLLNLPGDLGTLATTGSGFGSVVGDLANPVAGFIGSELAHLIAPQGKAVGGSIGGTVGGIAGGIGGGAVLGSEIGSFAGPIGTAAGALIGTLLGGLIGPNPKNHYFYLPTTAENGRLNFGQPTAQSVDSFSTLTGFQQQAANFNTFLDKTGLKLSSIEGPPLLLGTPNPHANDAIPTLPDLGSAFSKFRFTADNSDLNNLVNGVSFSDPNQLIAALTTGQKPSSSSPQPSAPTAQIAPSPTVVSPTPTPNSTPSADSGVIDPYQWQQIASQIVPTVNQSGGTG